MQSKTSSNSNKVVIDEENEIIKREIVQTTDSSTSKGWKSKQSDIVKFSDLESEFEDCDLEDAVALETKLRNVARKHSLTHDEMMRLLHKFVKNEHVLALVTLKAEDELAREKQSETEQRAIIITHAPPIPKLTRAKARELNKTPVISLPLLNAETEQPEIAKLIQDELNSDEEDEDFTLQEEELPSDDGDDPISAWDIESYSQTPLSPPLKRNVEDSSLKLSEEGCFKVPIDKESLEEDWRIAARTRSKLCLEQTTIEDIQSEFVPPDEEEYLDFSETERAAFDDEYMQFVNDCQQPLSNSFIADDDDLINDPEYVAAEKEPGKSLFFLLCSNNTIYYAEYNEEDQQSDQSQANDSLGVLTSVKTIAGDNVNIYLRTGNKILFCSGKYFYISHTTANTDHQKEYTGVVGVCHNCGAKIKGSLKVSSNFICHLKSKHPDVYKEFLKQKSETSVPRCVRKSEGTHSTRQENGPYPAETTMLTSSTKNEKQDQFHYKLLDFLIGTNQQFSLVESTYFIELLAYCNMPVQLKPAEYYKQLVKDACIFKKNALANFFTQTLCYLCLSVDTWCISNYVYTGIACHWIDELFQRQSSMLSCRRCNQSDDIEKDINETIQNIQQTFALKSEKIVTILCYNIRNCEDSLRKHCLNVDSFKSENVANDVKFLSLSLHDSMDVLRLHKIWCDDLVTLLTDDKRSLHAKVWEKCCSLWQSSQDFKYHYDILNILDSKLTPPSLFNLTSIYSSLKQLLGFKSKLSLLCQLFEKTDLTPTEIEYIEELVLIYEPWASAFEFLNLPQNQYYGCFLPTLVTLKVKLIKLHNSQRMRLLQDLLWQLKEKLLQQFKPYYELNESIYEAILAAISYPPVKTRFLMGLQDTSVGYNFQVRSLLLRYGKDYHNPENPTDLAKSDLHQPTVNSLTSATDFFDFGDNAQCVDSDLLVPITLKLEIDSYLADMDYSLTSLQKYPTIRHLFYRFNTPLPSPAIIHRSFSPAEILKSIDAEELRDVNISKKELTDLFAELFQVLISEGISLESVESETPTKQPLNQSDEREVLNTPHGTPETKIIETPTTCKFTENGLPKQPQSDVITSTDLPSSLRRERELAISSIETNQNDDQKEILNKNNICALIPIAKPLSFSEGSSGKTISISSNAINNQVDIIAVPLAGQPNRFQLAKVVNDSDLIIVEQSKEKTSSVAFGVEASDERYTTPYDNNYTYEYISVRRHVMHEYMEKFEKLRHAQVNQISSTTTETEPSRDGYGFTQQQYELMQQQMRIHVQMVTQSFLQTYSHPEYWKMAKMPQNLLKELKEKSIDNNNYKALNLDSALDLVEKWKEEVNDNNNEENREMMLFMHKEIEATNKNTRQIPRFPQRVMDAIVNSKVFMYPQYLPRIPFTPRQRTYEAFAPAESQLIAMGLEKHMKRIKETNEKVYHKTTPLRLACKRLCRDIVWGKNYRRVWEHIMNLKKANYYNPIKYYFDHDCAPPVELMPIIGFEDNKVLPPKERLQELPLVWKTYVQKKVTNSISTKQPKTSSEQQKFSTSTSKVKASKRARDSFLELVREAVGADITLTEDIKNNEREIDNANNLNQKKTKRKCEEATGSSSKRKKLPQTFTINVNYYFNSSLNSSPTATDTNVSALPLSLSACANELNETVAETSNPFSARLSVENDAATILNCQYSYETKCVQQSVQTNEQQQSEINNLHEGHTTKHFTDNQSAAVEQSALKPINVKFSKFKLRNFLILKRFKRRNINKYRERLYLRKRCEILITAYRLYLDSFSINYKHIPVLNAYYRQFKALELYTNFLKDLKMFVRAHISVNSGNQIPGSVKRTRNIIREEEDHNPVLQRIARKLNRQEENFKHMLLPDSPEEANRKDAIYAYNFYEKVEEAFKSSKKPENFKKFVNILKNFDPRSGKVSDLYYKLETLFLPEHPDLAEVFLTFLLPSEAAAIGKFFEHFMINNMSTFINKLNIYFNKQPAQIRKIYNCLNELAEDPEVTIRKVENKILPLLKGNQFLIDWFTQQFSQNAPPERLFSAPEHVINLKDCQNKSCRDHIETLNDLLDSPTTEETHHSCQLRYINGRIFYGSKILLPAKLSFMASSYVDKNNSKDSSKISGCAHGIRNCGENRLTQINESNTSQLHVEHTANDEQENSSEEENCKTLIIDTTAGEDDSCSSLECCDDSTLRSHAMRLNPSYYSSTCFTANLTSTPNIVNNNNIQNHHPNAKKTSLNFLYEDNKISPRKNSGMTGITQLTSSPGAASCNLTSSPVSVTNSALSCVPLLSKEKRKSPCKKTKSPTSNVERRTSNAASVQPMVVIHDTSSAITCAKRLKSLIDEEDCTALDSKEHINIIARPKSAVKEAYLGKDHSEQTVEASAHNTEDNLDDMEFLPEHSHITPSPFPSLKMETDSTEDEQSTSDSPINLINKNNEADASNKSANEKENDISSNSLSKIKTSPLPNPWTRDEDKIILIEMKMDPQDLYTRIGAKLPQRGHYEIKERHQFLIDFLAKLQER
uniref:Uncharacterized protein n=1 Tax=Glossina pallidipes TaxID=7398 RepID=A0A1A9ZY38_GLOPL